MTVVPVVQPSVGAIWTLTDGGGNLIVCGSIFTSSIFSVDIPSCITHNAFNNYNLTTIPHLISKDSTTLLQHTFGI